mmetsp:Transcript_42176/g.75542  ORF Transcript_42176/g.75542 Transcript_42176/m.75542 type:complete len:204 (+) Transcript_42176:936-1547(+)
MVPSGRAIRTLKNTLCVISGVGGAAAWAGGNGIDEVPRATAAVVRALRRPNALSDSPDDAAMAMPCEDRRRVATRARAAPSRAPSPASSPVTGTAAATGRGGRVETPAAPIGWTEALGWGRGLDCRPPRRALRTGSGTPCGVAAEAIRAQGAAGTDTGAWYAAAVGRGPPAPRSIPRHPMAHTAATRHQQRAKGVGLTGAEAM